MVLEKSRFSVFTWECKVTKSFASSNQLHMSGEGEVAKRFSIVNHKDWVVHATEVRPTITAVAHGKPYCG